MATLYISPASLSLTQNQKYTAAIRVDTAGEPVNTVQANLSYQPGRIEYVSIDYTGSAFPLQAEQTITSGSIKLARGTQGGDPPVNGDVLFATITFRAVSGYGSALLEFAAGSAIVRSTDSTDILSGTTPGTYSFTAESWGFTPI